MKLKLGATKVVKVGKICEGEREGNREKNRFWRTTVGKKSQQLTRSQESLNLAIDNSLILASGGELYHEQYDEHGVKIENQCFPY